jgi:hypothetical protein
MALKTYKFRSQVEMDLFLNGGIICGNDKAAAGLQGMVGLTLTFSDPAGSVTFSQPAGRDTHTPLLIGDIKDQIAAVPALADLDVLNLGGSVAFARKTDGEVVALPATNQLAKVKLGLAGATAITGKIYNPGGAAPVVPYVFWMFQGDGFWGFTAVE